MNLRLRQLLQDVARGEIGPAVAARAKEFLDGPDESTLPRRRPEQLGAAYAHHLKVRAVEVVDAKTYRKDVRAACVERAQGCCEACGSRRGPALHWDHFWGRGREESVESSWMLCAYCDHAKTESKTDHGHSRIHWLDLFASHCQLHGYVEQLAKTARAISLELAQHPEHRTPPNTETDPT